MTRNQDIRKEVLLQLYGARPLAVSPALMARQARKAGLDFTEEELAREAAFLEGAHLAQRLTDVISGEVKYAITTEGIIKQENA